MNIYDAIAKQCNVRITLEKSSDKDMIIYDPMTECKVIT